MVSPQQLEFSTPDGASHDTFSIRKSPRTPESKRAASDEAGAEEMTKKDKKKRKIKVELASSVINRIWNSEDELVVLKGLTDYKAERGLESKEEWEAFHPLIGDSITANFSKEHIMSKTRDLKRSFFDHLEKLKQGIDSHSTTFSNAEAFELAMKIWEKDEAGQEMLKENEEALNEVVENENTEEVQNNESGEEVLKEQNEVANAEPLIDNVADAEQFNDEEADAERFNDDEADAEQFNDDEADAEPLIDNVADAEQFNDDGADAEQFNDDGADAEQLNDDGAHAEQLNDDEADTEQLNDDEADAEPLIDNVADAEPLIDNVADAEQFTDDGADAEQFDDNWAVNVQQNGCGKELLVEENEVANSETLNENGVLKATEKVTAEKATEVEVAGKASQDADDGAVKKPEKEKQNAEDEFANVQDAFETLLSHDLSDHRKRLEIEKLSKLESGTRRKLSDEWNAICAREWNLKIRKFKFSAVLAEASKESR